MAIFNSYVELHTILKYLQKIAGTGLTLNLGLSLTHEMVIFKEISVGHIPSILVNLWLVTMGSMGHDMFHLSVARVSFRIRWGPISGIPDIREHIRTCRNHPPKNGVL